MSIVILAPNWLGDAVMALPAIRDVRRHFSGQPLSVAARPSIAPVFRAVPGIDRIIVLERRKESSQLRGDIGILLPNSFRSAWILKRAGVKERWGYRTDFRRPLLTRSVPKPRGRVSFPEYYSNLVRQLGVETGPLTAQLTVPSATSAAALSLLQERGWQPGQPLVGIAPGAAFGHAKRWSPKRYAELASLLIDAGVTCVILGRSEDRDAARDIKGIDLIGQTDLMMLMGIVSHCHVVVANDSGALHLAGGARRAGRRHLGTDRRAIQHTRDAARGFAHGDHHFGIGVLPPLLSGRLSDRSSLHEAYSHRAGARGSPPVPSGEPTREPASCVPRS